MGLSEQRCFADGRRAVGITYAGSYATMVKFVRHGHPRDGVAPSLLFFNYQLIMKHIIYLLLLLVASAGYSQDISKWPKHSEAAQTSYMASYRAFHGKNQRIDHKAAFTLMSSAGTDTNHINARMAYACFLRYGVACKADKEKADEIIGEVAGLVGYPVEKMLRPEYEPEKLLAPGNTVNPFNISELMLKRGYQGWQEADKARRMAEHQTGPPVKKN